MARKPLTARDKVNALLWRIKQQFGEYLKDPSGDDMKPGDDVVFDHTKGVLWGAGNSWEELRPVLRKTNQDKAKKKTRDYWHVKRILGETKEKPKRVWASKPFPARKVAWPSRPLRKRPEQREER